jgi:hypothetical protein
MLSDSFIPKLTTFSNPICHIFWAEDEKGEPVYRYSIIYEGGNEMFGVVDNLEDVFEQIKEFF